MKKSTFIFNLLATTAMAAGAQADVISGTGWSFNQETGLLKIEAEATNNGAMVGNFDSSAPWVNNGAIGAVNIKKIEFGEGVTSVGGFSNDWYPGLESVSFPSTLEKIEYYAFDGTPVSDLTFKDGTSNLEIGDYAFNDCLQLSSIELPDNLTKIGTYAFTGHNIASVTIPDNVTSIGDSAFSMSSGTFTSVVFGNLNFENLELGYESFYDLLSNVTAYCPNEACVNKAYTAGPGEAKLYSKDSDGVYTLSDVGMYASIEDMVNDTNMCDTHDACVALIASRSSISNGNGDNGGSGGSGDSAQSEPKRIYTLEEARQAVEASGKETVNVRIRYK